MNIKFTETEVFKRAIKKEKISSDDFEELKKELSINPEKGDVIKNSGGVRKIRMSIDNKGKSGGARVIYFYFSIDEEIFLITVYKKGNKENVTDEDLKIFKKLVKMIESGGLK